MLVSASGFWPLKVIQTTFPSSVHHWTNKQHLPRTAEKILSPFLSFTCPPFPIPCFTTSCIPLSFWTWDIVTPTPWEMGRGLKIKRKTISSTDGLVWGNEIACLIVACNGEQFEVNWGEIGHWATVCPSIVVRHKVYQRENHWTPKKTNSLSGLTNENYLALTDEIARSIVIVIKFLFFSSVPESGSWAWNTWQCPIHT